MATKPGKGPNERLQDLTDDPEKTMETLCINIASGGSLIELCETWGVRYGDMYNWIQQDKSRFERYNDSLNARNEWGRERILLEFRRLSVAEHTQFYDSSGELKPMGEWDSAMKSMVKDIYFNEDGQLQRVTFWNKEKALELLGKNIAMFNEHHTHSGKITLEDLVESSREHDG